MCDARKSVLLLAIFLSNISYSLSMPFLPIILEDRGISSTWTGIIFAIFSVATTFTSLIIGKVVDKIGHRTVIISSLILLAVSVFAFGFIIRLNSNFLLILVSSTLRFCQGKTPNRVQNAFLIHRFSLGSAYGGIITATYSYTSQAFSDEVEGVIALMEGVIGLGIAVGPICGIYVEKEVGFSYTFFIFGVLLIPFVFCVACLPRPGANDDEEKARTCGGSLLVARSERSEPKELMYSHIVCN